MHDCDLEKYYQTGGTYVIPVEIMNYLLEENKHLKQKFKATNKGLRKVLSKRLKWKRRYYKEKYIRKELKKWLEEEQNRLARECSQIYEDSLGKTRLVSEDIFNELTKVLDKIKELEEGVK